MERVTATQVSNLAKCPGRHRVDDNLYLHVRNSGRPSWVFRYVSPHSGKRRDMSLGSFPLIGLAQARQELSRWRGVLLRGGDPVEIRSEERRQIRSNYGDHGITLRSAAESLVTQLRPSWRNDKHADQWMRSLDHLNDLLDQDIRQIDNATLLGKLEPLNRSRHETTKRIRQRVEAIFDREIVRGHVDSNPATPLRRLLRGPTKKRHFASLPWRELPEFVSRLRDSDMAQSTRLGFEWLILSVGRTAEVQGATWPEIDRKNSIWTISGARMKAGSDHEVPITERMEVILGAMEGQRGDG